MVGFSKMHETNVKVSNHQYRITNVIIIEFMSLIDNTKLRVRKTTKDFSSQYNQSTYQNNFSPTISKFQNTIHLAMITNHYRAIIFKLDNVTGHFCRKAR